MIDCGYSSRKQGRMRQLLKLFNTDWRKEIVDSAAGLSRKGRERRRQILKEEVYCRTGTMCLQCAATIRQSQDSVASQMLIWSNT